MTLCVDSVAELLEGLCGYVTGYVSTDAGEAAAIAITACHVRYSDMTMKSMAEAEKSIGFMPISTFRIDVNGVNTRKQLEALITAFTRKDINIALVNDIGTKTVVTKSQRYDNPGMSYPASIVRIAYSQDVLYTRWKFRDVK